MADLIKDAITKFYNTVAGIDRKLNFITTKDDSIFDFRQPRMVGGEEWVIVKLAENNFIPFCISIWEKENKRNVSH